MNNFRKPHKKNKPFSLDGFIPNTPSLDDGDSGDFRKKFKYSYSPKKTLDANLQSRVDRVSELDEGFELNSPDISEPSRFSNSLEIDIGEPTKRKGFPAFFRKSKTRSEKKKPLRKRLAKGFLITFLALLLGIGSILGYGYLKTRQIFKGDGEGAAALQKDVDPSKLNGEGDGRVNILLLGKGGPGHTAPDLTDTILLASIDPVQNEAALLSVPRDLYVKDKNGYSTKINAIYSNAKQARLANSNSSNSDQEAAEKAGIQALEETVVEVLGVPIHYYVMVNFKAFEEAINTVGGITIDVKEPLYDATVAWELDGNPLIAGKGLQTFDGDRALFYARSRKGSARGDFDRTERQREIIVALKNKVLSLGTFSNPFKIVELLNTFGNNIRTDLNGINEIKRLYEISQNIGSDKIVSVGLADDPILVTTAFVDNQSVVRPVEGLYQYDEIHSFVRNTLRDAFLKQENARVVILNGTTTAGLATAKEKELKSYGYNVIKVENAPTSNYTNNRLIDLTSGNMKYTKSYLERRLGLRAENTIIDGLPTAQTADFVIILGTDEVNKTSSN